jgi:hypothetical protein
LVSTLTGSGFSSSTSTRRAGLVMIAWDQGPSMDDTRTYRRASRFADGEIKQTGSRHSSVYRAGTCGAIRCERATQQQQQQAILFPGSQR